MAAMVGGQIGGGNVGNASSGLDWGNLINTGLGAYGAFSGAQNQQGTSNSAQAGYGMARGAYNPTPYNMAGAGGTGFSVSSPTNGGPGSISTSLGGLQPGINNNLGLSQMFANYGANQLNNPLIGQANSAAGGLINSAAGGAQGAYQNALQSIMGQLGVSQGQTMQANNDAQFQRGQMGTTGGALQTRAMSQGFGLADLNAITQAQNQGLNFFNSNVSNAGSLNNMALGNQGMGLNFGNAGIGNFNATAGNMIGMQNQLGQLPLQYSQLQGNQQIGATSALAQMLRGGNNASAPASGYGTMANSMAGGGSGGMAGIGSLIGQGANFLQGLFSGNGNGSSSGGYDFNSPDMQNFGNLDTSQFAQPNPDMSFLNDAGLQDLGFNSAGGEAANQSGPVDPSVSAGYASNNPYYAAGGGASNTDSKILGSPSTSFGMSDFAQGAANAASIYGIARGMQSGTPSGQVSATLQAASLANKYGAFTGGNGADKALGNELGTAGGVLSMYNGLQHGGVQGYGSALSGGLKAASGIAGMAGNAGLAGGLGAAAGYVAAPLALYNAVANWQSGKTGSDALQGAEAGAAIGSVIPGIGTVIGGLVGGAIGALSSAFGPGAKDPENATFENYTKAYNQGGPNAVASATPSQTFQSLAGMFDLRNGQIKGNIPMYSQYGRMGEAKFTTDMAQQINSALTSGKIPQNASPQTIYSSVVTPWMNSWGKGQMKDSNAGAIQSMVTGLIGQWQGGALNSSTHVGIGGQTLNGLPTYGSPTTGSSSGSGSPTGQMFQNAMARSRMRRAVGGGRLA